MSSPPTPDPAHVAELLARAEQRRAALDELTAMGMALTKDIVTRSMDSPYHPELKHDPGRSFAASSRAVRLTLAFGARVDEHIFALRSGVVPVAKPSEPDAKREAPVSAASMPALRRRGDEEGGDQDRETLRDAIERESEDLDEHEDAFHRGRAFVVEGEDGDDGIFRDVDVDVGIDGIRAWLGLSPAPDDPDNDRVPRDPWPPPPDPEPPPRPPRDVIPANSA